MTSSVQSKDKEKLKSFALRKGRLTSAQKRALSSLKDKYCISNEREKINLKESFNNPQRKLIADVGFGTGESLIFMASEFPNINFVGIEVYPSGIGSTLNNAEQKSVSNIKIIESDVLDLFKAKVADEIFDSIVFLFPDPWPKRKHHKRRLLSENFLRLLYKKVVMGGTVFCKTDWEDYYLHMKKSFSSVQGWHLQEPGNFPLHIKSLPKTKYERKALEEGREVRQLLFRKI
tara:strand:+ start:18124 stop:18819 length:696 start_codon:yes stop_codon:yes gene_type:complete